MCAFQQEYLISKILLLTILPTPCRLSFMVAEMVLGYRLTKHAHRRCAQRGFRLEDIETVLRYGTPTTEGVLLRYRDILPSIEEIQKEIRQIERRSRRHK